jgi:hypothetical protein
MASGPLRSPGSLRSPGLLRSADPPRSPARGALAGVIAAVVTVLAVAGCGAAGSAAGPSPSASRVRTDKAVTSCGTTKTAANVPVRIEIPRGTVACGAAMNVERRYASAILAGRAPGNGGGGPVQVGGWTCEGFTTPVVLRTGNASKCVKGGTEILAILPAPA